MTVFLLVAPFIANGAAGRSTPAVQPSITFHEGIAPIIRQHCATCHRVGGPAPFPLQTYEDVREKASRIADAVARRTMPPWKPVAGYGEFVGERRLSDEAIRLIQQWVTDGAPEGALGHVEDGPDTSTAWRLGPPSLVVDMPGYVLEANRGDVYRSFVLPLPISERKYVRGLEFRPNASGPVHHANMRFDCTGRSRALDAEDPAPGYENITADSAQSPEGYFLGWTPGQIAPLSPPDLSWPLDPGCDLVLELHMRSPAWPADVSASLGFYFSERAPTRIPSLIRLGRQDIDIPPDARGHLIRDSYVLPVDAEVHTVQAHAHHLATEVRAQAVLPDGREQSLLYIDDWDFDWQDVYHYARPFWLPKGTTLVAEYTYDNSAANPHNPHTPPRRVRFGQRTTDEMGFLWLQVVTRTADDRALLNEETWRKNVTQDIVGLQVALEASPTDARLHSEVAYLHLQLGETDSARDHWQESVRIAPSWAEAHYDLGTLFLNEWRLEDAEAHLREATRLDPRHSDAYNNLGAVMVQLGRRPDAIASFKEAVSAAPGNGNAHYNLGKQLEELHELEDAISHYRDALRVGLDDRDVNVSLASVLARQRRFEEAVGYYERALTHDPDLVPALVDLAWIVTDPNSSRYEPPRAVQLAERAKSIAERQGQLDPTILDVLSVAYAAEGRLAEAIKSAETGLRLIGSAGREMLAAAMRKRLEEWTRLQTNAPP